MCSEDAEPKSTVISITREDAECGFLGGFEGALLKQGLIIALNSRRLILYARQHLDRSPYRMANLPLPQHRAFMNFCMNVG
jgi:hypothetical protein